MYTSLVYEQSIDSLCYMSHEGLTWALDQYSCLVMWLLDLSSPLRPLPQTQTTHTPQGKEHRFLRQYTLLPFL